MDMHRWGVPVLAEALPRGFEPAEDSRTPENITFACRQSVELGADFVKSVYTGDQDSFKKLDPGKLIVITASAPIRTMSSAFTVICIGFDLSPRKDTPPSALTMIPFPRKESVKYSAIPTVERKASAPAAAISLTNFFGSCNAGNVLKFAAWSIAIINVFPSVLKM